MSQPTITTPCIGICSTVFGDAVCRGCKRYETEIIQWNSFDQTQKRAVDERLQAHLEQILCDKFTIESPELFERLLIDNNVRYMRNRSAICWINDLLRTSVVEEQGLAAFGIGVVDELAELCIETLRNGIDSELFELSQAHYQRYIMVNQ